MKQILPDSLMISMRGFGWIDSLVEVGISFLLDEHLQEIVARLKSSRSAKLRSLIGVRSAGLRICGVASLRLDRKSKLD